MTKRSFVDLAWLELWRNWMASQGGIFPSFFVFFLLDGLPRRFFFSPSWLELWRNLMPPKKVFSFLNPFFFFPPLNPFFFFFFF